MAETSFSFEYVLSVSLALGATYLVNKNAPHTNAILQFVLIPLIVAYVSLFVFNSFFPKLNALGQQYGGYFEDKALTTLDGTNYVQLFPPFLFVMILFFVLLSRGDLG